MGEWDPFEREGRYAEMLGVEPSPTPGSLTLEQAGVMAGVGLTALRGLQNTLALKPGEAVMIFGASGGIGSADWLKRAMSAVAVSIN